MRLTKWTLAATLIVLVSGCEPVPGLTQAGCAATKESRDKAADTTFQYARDARVLQDNAQAYAEVAAVCGEE